MNFVALRMLTGDRAKYFGLVFAIAFCTFLLKNQTSIFRGTWSSLPACASPEWNPSHWWA